MKLKAFTLAEVLITLGIIGVVAAMTLPTVINNFRKKQTVAQLKKAYSTLAQAFTMAQKDYGDVSEWNIGSNMSMDSDNQDVNNSLRNFAKQYLIPYLRIVKDCDAGSEVTGQCDYDIYNFGNKVWDKQSNSNEYRFIVNNTMIVALRYNNNGEYFGDGIFVRVDINGKQKPNTFGEDIFYMYLNRQTKKFNMQGIEQTRENMLNGSRGCANRTSAHYGKWCCALIEHDGWEIKDDYPHFN